MFTINTGTNTLQLFKKYKRSQEPLERTVITKAAVAKNTIKSNKKNKNLISSFSFFKCYIIAIKKRERNWLIADSLKFIVLPRHSELDSESI